MSFSWWVDSTQMETQIWTSKSLRVTEGAWCEWESPSQPRSGAEWVWLPRKLPHHYKAFIMGSLTGSGCELALELLCIPKASSLHPPDRTLLLGPHLSLSLGPQPSEPPAAGPSVWRKEHPLIPLSSAPGVSPGASCLARRWEGVRKFQGSCSYCWESSVMLRGCWRSVFLP